jgi:MFS family permease
MNRAIGLTPALFGLGAGLFFAGYVAGQVPSNLILLRVGARVWIARVVVAWGLVSMASAFVVGPRSFCAMRILLGLAESGFFPGTILYLSLWFPARQRAMAMAAFMAAAPLSTAIGSPISGALMGLPRLAGLANWQWLYILEGLPAILLGLLTLKVLTDTPDQATWLDAGERDWLVETLRAERVAGATHRSGIAAVWAVLRDGRVLVLALAYSGTSAGLYAIGFWAPLLIRQLGYPALTVGWLNALPGVVAVVAMVAWARNSDRTQDFSCSDSLPGGMRRAGVGGICAYRAGGDSGVGVGELRSECSQGSDLGGAEPVFVGRKRGDGDCPDQLAGQPGRIRGARSDRVDEGPVGELCQRTGRGGRDDGAIGRAATGHEAADGVRQGARERGARKQKLVEAKLA